MPFPQSTQACFQLQSSAFQDTKYLRVLSVIVYFVLQTQFLKLDPKSHPLTDLTWQMQWLSSPLCLYNIAQISSLQNCLQFIKGHGGGGQHMLKQIPEPGSRDLKVQEEGCTRAVCLGENCFVCFGGLHPPPQQGQLYFHMQHSCPPSTSLPDCQALVF